KAHDEPVGSVQDPPRKSTYIYENVAGEFVGQQRQLRANELFCLHNWCANGGEGGILRPIQKTMIFQHLDKNRLSVFGAGFCSKRGGSIPYWISNEYRVKAKEHLCE